MGESHTGRTTAQGAASKKRILDSAIELICERGFSGTSVGAVCEKAGVVKTALYWHFGSKDGLLAAIIEEISREWIEEIDSRASGVDSADASLDGMIEGMKNLVNHKSHYLRIVEAVINESANVDHEAMKAIRRLNRKGISAIEAGLERAMGMPLPDQDLLAQTIHACLHTALRQNTISPGSLDVDRYFKDVRRTVIVLVRDRVERVHRDKKKKASSKKSASKKK